MTLNGPEPTGFEFVNVAGSFTFDQMCCGTTKARFRTAGMNCESDVFSLITTACAPLALIEAMLWLPLPTRPMRSITGLWRPAVRLYTTSATVSGLPSDHFALGAIWSVSVLFAFVHFQLRASHGTVWTAPAEVAMRGS